jgi:competence protein ComEC
MLALLPLALGLGDAALRSNRPAEPAPVIATATNGPRRPTPRPTSTGQTGPVSIHYINVGQAAAAIVDLKGAAIMIDAGGETTENNEYADHLIDYLNRFFQDRPQLNNTLNGIIISHPHIDHTKNLAAVMQSFTVKNLVDGGDDSGSGFPQLRKAREFARDHDIPHIAVSNTGIGRNGRSIKNALGLTGTADVVLLSGSRDCDNQNNNSLTVQVVTPEGTVMFTGDSEEDGDQTCDSGMLAFLEERFAAKLDVDVYHAAHHGSFNGTTDEFMKLVTPKVSIISAGNPATRSPGPFHAFQFGHPREVAVNELVQNTSMSRERKTVTILPKAKISKTIDMTKAVYCTCWDGDIIVSYTENNKTPTVTTSGFQIGR